MLATIHAARDVSKEKREKRNKKIICDPQETRIKHRTMLVC
jgi:hypothetical protein